MATKFKAVEEQPKLQRRRYRYRSTLIAGVSTILAGYLIRRSEKKSAVRHGALDPSVRRGRSGGFDMDDPFDVSDAEEVAGLPPATYTRDNLPALSSDTKAYLAQLKVRAKALPKASN